MKKNVLLLIPVLIVCISMTLIEKIWMGTEPVQKARTTEVIGCAPDGNEQFKTDINGKFIPLLPGWGNHSYAITTSNDSAQIYFNQGLSMYYSYHWREAVASFKEAIKFDSSSAILYWAQALALGPTYNYGYNYKMNKDIPAILQRMNQYKDQASAKEKDLIDAMNRRYHPQDATDEHRKQLNEDYAKAMETIVTKYPDDIEMKALYTDAVMLVHPWSFWNNDGTPKSWTPQLVQYCRDILEKSPQHPAGLHYYIHVTEASRKPDVALASADSLIKLYPGIAHMVHMSSHEYERIGYYEKGVHANEAADRSLGQYAEMAKGLNLSVHTTHYFAVDAYCALSGAMYQKAIPKAMAVRNSVNPTAEDTYNQYMYMLPYIAMTRMGKWQEILDDPTSVHPDWKYAGILYDFAKGMAYAKTGNYTKAEKHLQALIEKQKDQQLRKKFTPYMSSPYECSIIAENILLANIEFLQKKYTAAITSIKKAIMAEDNLIYSEPNLWMLPARQYLGAFLLTMNKPTEAEKIYREDLMWNPGNGWSMLGLYQSLTAQNKKTELNKIKERFEYSFSKADQLPTASAY
ncbi:MAG: hypothetical protein KGZ74_15930 [Chitinophagaceae bacterium]|nr:hypothetical protein [Chitinophagaceae bacterium]